VSFQPALPSSSAAARAAASHRPGAPQALGRGVQGLGHGFPGGRERGVGGVVDGLAGNAQQFLDGGHDVRRFDGRVIDQFGHGGEQGVLGHGVTGL